jgi:hypothetical protein
VTLLIYKDTLFEKRMTVPPANLRDLPFFSRRHATSYEISSHAGAVGLMGAMACLLVLLRVTPAPTSLPEYALMREAMGAIATWIFLPSLGLTLIAGLLAMALNPAYHNAGWAG